ncbi:hypothetical protein QE152_g31382 [Popillia japonica]|uniref:Uncharacterized protein n=1 Tax=Popillia japonica TaxID=7064 RepID=A0AAW1J1M1_POPJA
MSFKGLTKVPEWFNIEESILYLNEKGMSINGDDCVPEFIQEVPEWFNIEESILYLNEKGMSINGDDCVPEFIQEIEKTKKHIKSEEWKTKNVSEEWGLRHHMNLPNSRRYVNIFFVFLAIMQL